MRYLKRQSAMILIGLFLLAGALVSGFAHAQQLGLPGDSQDIPIQTEIIIPGSETIFDGGLLRGRVRDIADYLNIIYNFLISIVGVLAGVFILVGGFQYMTAGGDASRVGAAKKRIGNALLGMVLALSSYILLNTINPELVNLKLPEGLGKKVTTELAFLPLCEDLIRQGLQVTSMQKEFFGYSSSFRTHQCGDIGEYIPEGSGADGAVYCMYAGLTCGIESIDTEGFGPYPSTARNSLYKACLPASIDKYDIPEIIKVARALKEKLESEGRTPQSIAGSIRVPSIGKCTTCAQISWFTRDFYKEALGYDETETYGDGLCKAWSASMKVTATLGGRSEWPVFGTAWCGYDPVAQGCVQVDFNSCAALDECSDYDSASTPTIETKDAYGIYSGRVIGAELDDVPRILPVVCTENPCGVNAERGGCVPGSTGPIDAMRFVAFGEGGENDCVNR